LTGAGHGGVAANRAVGAAATARPTASDTHGQRNRTADSETGDHAIGATAATACAARNAATATTSRAPGFDGVGRVEGYVATGTGADDCAGCAVCRLRDVGPNEAAKRQGNARDVPPARHRQARGNRLGKRFGWARTNCRPRIVFSNPCEPVQIAREATSFAAFRKHALMQRVSKGNAKSVGQTFEPLVQRPQHCARCHQGGSQQTKIDPSAPEPVQRLSFNKRSDLAGAG